MDESIVAALLAFAGYSLLNIGQAGQKIGLGLRAHRPALAWTLWVFATAATSVSFWLVFFAITIGSVTIAGAMAGTGLASLAVFARFVMKERLRPRDVVAVAVIVAAAAVMAIFGRANEGHLNRALLYALLGGGTAAYLVAIAVGAIVRGRAKSVVDPVRRSSATGALIGGLSGFLGAGSQLFQELGTAEIALSDGLGPLVLAIITNPVTAIWVGLSVVSMIVIQFAYERGEAIAIIPVFTANFIVVPVVGGALVFGLYLTVPQWISVAAILAGSIALGRRTAPITVKDQGDGN